MASSPNAAPAAAAQTAANPASSPAPAAAQQPAQAAAPAAATAAAPAAAPAAKAGWKARAAAFLKRRLPVALTWGVAILAVAAVAGVLWSYQARLNAAKRREAALRYLVVAGSALQPESQEALEACKKLRLAAAKEDK